MPSILQDLAVGAIVCDQRTIMPSLRSTATVEVWLIRRRPPF